MSTLGPITASWGADISSAAKGPNDGSDYCGGSGTASYRVANRFDLSSLPANAIVSQVDLTINVASVATAGSLLWDLGCYGADGTGDPETDAVATAYAACAPGNVYLNDDTTFRTTGVKSLTNLGSQANTDVQAAAGGTFAIAIRETTDTTAGERCEFSEYTDATNPPKLTITYTVPAKGLIMLMGDGGFL